MPTYEYQCNACKKRFEQYQSIKDKALKKCPSCGKNALERLIGVGSAVIFKGSGFYQTDYRSESYKKAAEAESKAGEPTATPGKSEGKEAATPAGASAPAEPAASGGASAESETTSRSGATRAKGVRSSASRVAKATRATKASKKKR